MSLKLNYKAAVLSLPFLLLSCNVAENPVEPGVDQVKLYFAVDSFEETVPTRTVVSDPSKGTIHWAEGDVVGVFPYEGYQEPFEIPLDQINQANAKFDGGYWALREGLQYNAYYPFDQVNFASADMKTRIPVNYLGQTQYGSAVNTGNYDFSYSDWQTAPASGAVTFNFHHLGAFLVMNVAYPETATYTRMDLVVKSTTGESTYEKFPIEGTYDLTYNMDRLPGTGESYVKIPLTPSTYKDRIGLDLYNTEGTDGIEGIKGESATFYMMLPQVNLPALTTFSAEIRFELKDKNGNIYQSASPLIHFQSGKKYTYSLAPVLEFNGDVTVTPEIKDWENQTGSGTMSPSFD